MSKHKKSRKQTIRIIYKDGKEDTLPQKMWDDYDYFDRLFVVMKDRQWIAIINLDVVASIAVG